MQRVQLYHWYHATIDGSGSGSGCGSGSGSGSGCGSGSGSGCGCGSGSGSGSGCDSSYGAQGLQNPRDREHAYPGQTSSRLQPVRKSALESGDGPLSIAVLRTG
jgi:hypothetical protein